MILGKDGKGGFSRLNVPFLARGGTGDSESKYMFLEFKGDRGRYNDNNAFRVVIPVLVSKTE